MPKQKRSDDWGFPRWRSYCDKGRAAARIRLCDREGCSEIGDRPAPTFVPVLGAGPTLTARWVDPERGAPPARGEWALTLGDIELF